MKGRRDEQNILLKTVEGKTLHTASAETIGRISKPIIRKRMESVDRVSEYYYNLDDVATSNRVTSKTSTILPGYMKSVEDLSEQISSELVESFSEEIPE